MKLKKWIPTLEAAALAFLIAFGNMGCLVTGFRLPVSSMAMLGLVCAAVSIASAVCFYYRHGGTLLLCLMMLAAGLLWYDGRAVDQFLVLAENVTELFDNAYRWGSLDFDVRSAVVDIPIGVVGCFVAITITQTVTRAYWTWPGVLMGLMPAALCFIVTDTVPKEIYLYLLMLGMILLILSARLRQQDLRQAYRVILMAAAPTALALAVLFLAAPKDGYVNQAEDFQDRILEWLQLLPEKLEETASEVIKTDPIGKQSRLERLDSLGRRIPMQYAVMDVNAAQTGTLYLRGQDFDQYSGTTWTATENRVEAFPLSDYEALFIGETVGNVTITTRQEKDILYLPYYTKPYTQLVGGRAENQTGTKSYIYTQRTLPDDWRAIVKELQNQIDGISSDVDIRHRNLPGDHYLALPEDTREGAEELLEEILTTERSATEKADAIARYVRSSAVYDLNPGRMPSGEEDFAIWFLKKQDKGYCVHFASATAVLLRAAGVHARYVTGYMAEGIAGQTVTVTDAQAHAWVEYYEPRLDVWIPLESTPASPDSPVPEPEETEPQAGTEPERDPTRPHTGTTEPTDPDGPTEPGQTEAPTQPTEREQEEKTSSGNGTGWLLWLLPAAAVGAVILQWRLRLDRRRFAQRRGKPNRRALAMWKEHELLRRQLGEPVSKELEDLALKAKFSQHTLTKEELLTFRMALEEDRKWLKEKPWYRQIYFRLILALY